MFFTYPLELYIARDTIEQQFFSKYTFSYVRHTIVTLLIIGSTLLTSSLTCNLGIILEITGGVGASLIAFIAPCSLYLRSCHLLGKPLGKVRFAHYALIAFGIGVIILTICLSVLGQVDKANKGVPPRDCNW
jgi:sodium-coupled neutral amino acid transporter 11